jgi:hypothetical protein
MANATVSRLGIGSGSTYTQPPTNQSQWDTNNELFLKLWSGETQAAFDANTVLRERTRVRTIQSGKSAQFPAIGKTVAEYHAAGTELTGRSIKQDERVITIDDMLVSHTFVADIDELKNHYDVRGEFTNQMGKSLALTYDRNLFAAAGAEILNPTGSLADQGVAEKIDINTAVTGVVDTDSPTETTNDMAELIDALYLCAQKLDEKFVPETDRFVYVTPQIYYGLVQNDKILNRDFVTNNGDYANASVLRVAGMQIVKTTNMAVNHGSSPQINSVDRFPDFRSQYSADMSSFLALVMHPEALGTVQLAGLSTESSYDPRRLGTLMVSKMAVGHGVLRPECMIGITGNTPTDA